MWSPDLKFRPMLEPQCLHPLRYISSAVAAAFGKLSHRLFRLAHHHSGLKPAGCVLGHPDHVTLSIDRGQFHTVRSSLLFGASARPTGRSRRRPLRFCVFAQLRNVASRRLSLPHGCTTRIAPLPSTRMIPLGQTNGVPSGDRRSADRTDRQRNGALRRVDTISRCCFPPRSAQ